jgi:hypothetical protein
MAQGISLLSSCIGGLLPVLSLSAASALHRETPHTQRLSLTASGLASGPRNFRQPETRPACMKSVSPFPRDLGWHRGAVAPLQSTMPPFRACAVARAQPSLRLVPSMNAHHSCSILEIAILLRPRFVLVPKPRHATSHIRGSGSGTRLKRTRFFVSPSS